MTRKPALSTVTLLFAVFLSLSACQKAPVIFEQQEVMMGTIMKIKTAAAGRTERETREACQEAFDEIARLEMELSEWKPETPISQINRLAGMEKATKIPASAVEVTRSALEIATRTNGEFDITFKPIGRLWNVKERLVPPSADSIKQALSLVDYSQIELDTLASPATLRLAKKGMELGFGGIAKGYAALQAGEVLRSRGFDDFIINAGGDLYISGTKGDRHWVSGIKNPQDPSKPPVAKFEVIADCGIATSGDYENYFTWEGERYHHIIDLSSGYPAKGMKSSTVFSVDPSKADAYATAFFIMGYEKALEVVQQDPTVAFILIDNENNLLRSPNLSTFIKERTR
ncbi:FAD:protein FMN transferase [Prosthecochloris vibrioformis]|uniref:FAD:protein FMN transferase n=1 Tax=Prosthecochloris vibrioformis TaxID=1098 RepID=A0A5C4S191_PROVB|nr:FAD:protein FMN transferase [Prosthecochloris vibrioformis]TNJ36877.1 FAD:protein FMN transferase [Prosthecochloris vibrioformis]